MDEISTHAAALPTGRAPGEKLIPSVYRMVGMSATLMRLFKTDAPSSSRYMGSEEGEEDDDASEFGNTTAPRLWRPGRNGNVNDFTRLGGGNLLKCLFLPDPQKRAVPHGEARTNMSMRVSVQSTLVCG